MVMVIMCDIESKYCTPSVSYKNKIIRNDSEICADFDFGTSLGMVQPLLQIIFKYLPYEDLKSASLVSEQWSTYANEELQKRNNASWISLVKTQVLSHNITNSSNFRFDNVAFGLIFFKYGDLKLHKYLCVHSDPIVRMTFAEYLKEEICPPNIDFWVFSCSHIYPPKEIGKFECSFTGLFIPEISNINIKSFCIQQNKIDKLYEKSFAENEHIHCALLFTTSYPLSLVKKFTKEIFKRQSPNSLALGGGIISGGIKQFQEDKTVNYFNSKTLYCIALTQDKNKVAMFDSYSIVIKGDFEKKLIEFRNNIKLRKHSFAFRMCCFGKDDKELETAIFNRIFPNTFVVGFDVDGEIGLDKFNAWQPENDIPEVKKSKSQQNLIHEFTTIVVIITWGMQL